MLKCTLLMERAHINPFQIFSVDDVAKIFGVNRRTVLRWIRMKRIKDAQIVGNAWAIPAASVDSLSELPRLRPGRKAKV